MFWPDFIDHPQGFSSMKHAAFVSADIFDFSHIIKIDAVVN